MRDSIFIRLRSLQLLVVPDAGGTVWPCADVGGAAVSLGTYAAPFHLHQVVPFGFQLVTRTFGDQFVHLLPFDQRIVFHLPVVCFYLFRSALDHASTSLIVHLLAPHFDPLEIFLKVFVHYCRVVHINISGERRLTAIH